MKKLLLFLSIALTIISCSSSNGDKFLGSWKNENRHRILTITKLSGNDYKVRNEDEVKEGGNSFDNMMRTYQENNFTFKDGKLIGPMGITIITDGSDISYDGKTYIKN